MTDTATKFRECAERLEPETPAIKTPCGNDEYPWIAEDGDQFEYGPKRYKCWPQSKLGLWECVYYEPKPKDWRDANVILALVEAWSRRTSIPLQASVRPSSSQIGKLVWDVRIPNERASEVVGSAGSHAYHKAVVKAIHAALMGGE